MTTQADIIALFSPYVVIDEVVMKGSFCFVVSTKLGSNLTLLLLIASHIAVVAEYT